MFSCLECGKRFRSPAAAESAANDGCPRCGGVDIDLYIPSSRPLLPRALLTTAVRSEPDQRRRVAHAAAQAHLRTSRYAAPRQFI